MTDISHRTIDVNDLSMHVAEAGTGPLVVLLHGFPECWFTWRHQLRSLAEAGFHVVAPDQRGFGETGGPDEVDRYTQLHLVGDVVALIGALGEGPAVVAGHDWGAPVAWNLALLRPDLVRGVVGLSVPYLPRGAIDQLTALDGLLGPRNYQRYFQDEGPAEAEMEADTVTTMRRWYHGLSGDVARSNPMIVPEGQGILDVLDDTEVLPAWLPADDLATMAGVFERSGFRRPLHWYRNSRANCELLAAWTGAPITVPALYISGDKDVVYAWPGMSDVAAMLSLFAPQARPPIILPGCGHWTGEERPDEVSAALVEFARSL